MMRLLYSPQTLCVHCITCKLRLDYVFLLHCFTWLPRNTEILETFKLGTGQIIRCHICLFIQYQTYVCTKSILDTIIYSVSYTLSAPTQGLFNTCLIIYLQLFIISTGFKIYTVTIVITSQTTIVECISYMCSKHG